MATNNPIYQFSDWKPIVPYVCLGAMAAHSIYSHCRWSSTPVQSSFLGKVRLRLAHYFGISRLARMHDRKLESESGWRILPLCFLLVNLVVAISHLYEGHSRLALNVMLPQLGFAYFVTIRGASYRITMLMARLMALHELFSLFFIFTDEISSSNIRRAVLVRALGSILFLETLDEAFIQFIVLSLMTLVHFNDMKLVFLPIRTYLGVVLPMQVMGVREWACERNWFDISPHAETLTITTVLILPTVGAIFCTFGRMRVSRPDSVDGNIAGSRHLFDFILLTFHMLVFIVSLLLKARIDHTITPAAVTIERKLSLDWSQLQAERKSPPQRTASSTSDSTTSLLTRRMKWAHNGGLIHLMLLVVQFAQAALMMYCETSRHMLTLVTLSTIRLALLSLDERPFGMTQLETSPFRALFVYLSSELSTNARAIVAIVPLLEIMVTYLACSRQERSARLVSMQKDVRSELDHSVKQKFSVIGTALEQVLETVTKTNGEPGGILRQLLEDSLHECKARQDGCHLVKAAQAVSMGIYQSHASPCSLRQQVNAWHASGVLDTLCIVESNAIDIPITLDWDLFRLVLSDWSRGRPVIVEAVMDGGSGSHVRIHVRKQHEDGSPSPPSLPDLYSRVVNGIGTGRLSDTDLEVEGPVSESLEGDSLSTPPSHCEAKGGLPPVPCAQGDPKTEADTSESSMLESDSDLSISSGLVYAVLDDNKLVRMNALRLLKQAPLQCSSGSFVSGATMDECEKFAQLIAEREVDVAVFDQNLDFPNEEGSTIRRRGSDIARIAKDVYGFHGTMVLHSANGSLADTLETDLFDGFIEKSASKQSFLSGVCTAWKTHQHRLKAET